MTAEVCWPDNLIGCIKSDLRRNGESIIINFPADHPEADQAAKEFRSYGRRAGRELGWKVRTYVATVDKGSSIRVGVVIHESTPEHQNELWERGQEMIRKGWEAFSRLPATETPT